MGGAAGFVCTSLAVVACVGKSSPWPLWAGAVVGWPRGTRRGAWSLSEVPSRAQPGAHDAVVLCSRGTNLSMLSFRGCGIVCFSQVVFVARECSRVRPALLPWLRSGLCTGRNSFCQQGSLAVKLLPLLVLLGMPLLPCPGCKDSPIWHLLGIVPGS